MKKIFIISFVLLLIVLIFLGIYTLAFREKKENPNTLSQAQENTSAALETLLPDEQQNDVSSQTITSLGEDPVLAPVLTPGGNRIRYVNSFNGNVEEIDLRGTNKKVIFNNNFSDISHVAWSQDRSFVLVQSREDASYFVYNLAAQTKTPFKAGVDFAQWTSVGNRVLYKFFDQQKEERSLNISDADGANWKQIASIPWRRVSFSQVPRSSSVVYWNSPNAFEQTALLRKSIVSDGPEETLFSSGFGADYALSPDGEKIVVSFTDQQGGAKTNLALIDKNGNAFQNLDIPTFVKKIAWSQDATALFYALPSGVPVGTILPNDYDANVFFTQDTFWKIDLASGKKDRLVPLEDITQPFDAEHFFVTPSNDFLFFVNRLDGRLYRLSLGV